MDRFVIEGGRPLRGTVSVSGAKNAALPLLAATILADGPCRLVGIPDLRDVRTMLRILETLGVRSHREKDGTIVTEVVDPEACKAPYELVKTMRASISVLGPLVGRRGRAEVSFPGGCVLGPRPVDLHLRGLEALGCHIEVADGYIRAQAGTQSGDTREVFLGGPFGPTTTGTANLIAASVLRPGVTILQFTACEPEVVDLANFLVAMGAQIEGIGSPTLRITGVDALRGATHRVIPDRMEAGTFLCAAAITGGEVAVRGADPAQLTAPLTVLRRMGVQVRSDADGTIHVAAQERLQPADLVTLPYPGFPTDLQPQFLAMLTVAAGNSFVTEKIYPERFIHVAEFQRMGAHIRKEGPTAMIQGVERLSGCPVMGSDLRGCAALVLAALAAQGETSVERVYHIDRGYEAIEDKLTALGAQIERRADR